MSAEVTEESVQTGGIAISDDSDEEASTDEDSTDEESTDEESDGDLQ